jgi:hypothetical protein
LSRVHTPSAITALVTTSPAWMKMLRLPIMLPSAFCFAASR